MIIWSALTLKQFDHLIRPIIDHLIRTNSKTVWSFDPRQLKSCLIICSCSLCDHFTRPIFHYSIRAKSKAVRLFGPKPPLIIVWSSNPPHFWIYVWIDLQDLQSCVITTLPTPRPSLGFCKYVCPPSWNIVHTNFSKPHDNLIVPVFLLFYLLLLYNVHNLIFASGNDNLMGWSGKNQGHVSMQEWHDKDPTLCKRLTSV